MTNNAGSLADERVEVVQEDRDAAAAIASGFGCHATAEQIVAGRLDDDPSVQALARHRHRFASPQTVGEVGLERLGEALFIFSDRLREHSGFFEEKRNHDAYEAVVAAYQALYPSKPKAADTIASLTAERDAALARCEGGLRGIFLPAILHGDDEHRAWLTAAVEAYLAGDPIPAPTGSGRKEALIAALQARCERLEGAVENEREECAKVADRAIKDFALTTAENKSPGACAAVAYNAIRARAALGEGGGR
jgi:hypothetical protein